MCIRVDVLSHTQPRLEVLSSILVNDMCKRFREMLCAEYKFQTFEHVRAHIEMNV